MVTFQTSILSEDLTLAGPVIANLMVSISGTDADFIVKLIDVFPDDFKYEDFIITGYKPHSQIKMKMSV